ncbi:peptidase domain-containing ABC transporter [Balneola sp. MJW-20]|uniref:peptidase domain-containing ABC transporter n=1 Tax=Gracilimonas aurantiaca TaxID=3234185 RepID=UPI003465BF24
MSTTENSLSPMQRFIRLLKPDYDEIRNVYVYAVFAGLVSLSLPLGIQAIVNLIQGGQVSTAWIVLVIFVVLGVAVAGILQIFQLRIVENLQQRIFTRAAFEFAYRIPRIRMESLYRHYAPELMNRFFDTISVQKGLSKILIDFSQATLQVVFGLILLSFYHPFFIAFSVILVVLILVIFRFTAKRGLETSLKESKYKYEVVHWLEEMARTYSSFKLAGQTDLPLVRTNGLAENYLEARESHFQVLLRQYSLMVIFKVIVATGLLVVGSILVMEQLMNIGQFVAAEIIILTIINSVEKLNRSIETVYDVLTAFEKIGMVTDLSLDQHKGIDLEEKCKDSGLEVEFNDVIFRYPDYPKNTLNEMSLVIPAKERLLITGVNGSGKSTFLQILAGLYDIQSGHISYNGFTKGNIDISSLRTVIGAYLTKEHLFQGTVFENIAMGRKDATFENVQWAVNNLGLSDFIRQSPEGYDTMLDPQGRKLPRSIIQKLLLARTIVVKPKMLILEDPFEHLFDEEKERLVDFLVREENNWSIVTVSSDYYLASCCDRIAIMDDGRISEIGTFDEMKDKAPLNTQNHA